MPCALITGANRGLGLEFTRQYLADGWQVIACCRSPQQAAELQQLQADNPALLTIKALDVTDYPALEQLAAELSCQSVDLLLCNAGLYGPKKLPLGDTDTAAWREVLEANTIAPLRLAEVFLPLVAGSELKKMAFVSSKMGSMSDNHSGGSYIYRSSKAALNAVTRSLSVDLAPQQISVVTLHPGWVRTRMGGPHGLIDPPESVSGMRQVIRQLCQENSGQFINYNGAEIGW